MGEEGEWANGRDASRSKCLIWTYGSSSSQWYPGDRASYWAPQHPGDGASVWGGLSIALVCHLVPGH